jgi:hypothetical protein
MFEGAEMTAGGVQVSGQHGEQRRGFVKGKSGNPLGARLVIEKRAAMLADLERECGRSIVGTDRIMAERGIEVLTRRPRSHDEAVRLLNAGSRIIDRLRDKYTKREPVAPVGSDLDAYLRKGATA